MEMCKHHKAGLPSFSQRLTGGGKTGEWGIREVGDSQWVGEVLGT